MLNPETQDIIRIVRTYAYQNGLTLSEFSEKADVSKSWISRLRHEDGSISLEVARKLLEASGYKIIVKHQSNINDSDTQEIKTMTDKELDELQLKKKKDNFEKNIKSSRLRKADE